MKLLQWKNPRQHWVMKSPDATRSMLEALEVFPDITLVWPHRDPVKAMASAVNTLGALAWTHTDQALPPGLFEFVTNAESCAAMLCGPIEQIERNPKLRAQLCNVLYGDFLRNPIGVVERIYAISGRAVSNTGRAAMQKFMDDYPRTSRPTHSYDIGSKDQITKERVVFTRYQEYFSVPNEV
jgi:hypothetical protein